MYIFVLLYTPAIEAISEDTGKIVYEISHFWLKTKTIISHSCSRIPFFHYDVSRYGWIFSISTLRTNQQDGI